MDADKPRRRWYLKKRWLAVIALWLALPVLYPLSLWPVTYISARGWWHPPEGLYRPISWATFRWRLGNVSRVLRSYERSAKRLAGRHNQAERDKYWRAPDKSINRTHWTPPQPATPAEP
jgi:hypothetical protein